MSRTLTALLGSLALSLATPAFAAPPHAEPTHEAAAGEHGAQAEGGEQGGAHGEHHYYTGDDDADGTPNWRDGDSELFMVAKLGYHLFNLVLFFGLIFFFVRRPATDAVRGRALTIRKAITDSAKQREAAKERHDDVTARLHKLEDEIAKMRADGEADAAVEGQKMVERARVEAERIGQTAQRNIRDEIARARVELRRDAVELAVKLAENTLREAVSADDQQRLARDFLATLNEGASADV